MKTRLLSIIICLLPLAVYAQKGTIIEALESNKTEQGSIIIESDSDITSLLGTPSKKADLLSDDQTIVQMKGFRLMAYMSNDTQKGKTVAHDRRTQISEKFPEIGTYILYESPNWKLLVGDFVTREEANIFRQQLQKEFPQFGKEAYLVNTVVNVPIVKSE